MASLYAPLWKRSSTLFLRGVVVLVGVVALALMLWEPHLEGRNANATLFEVYFNDPFLAYAYLASIPFFAALWLGFKVLGHVGGHQAFSPEVVKSLRMIQYCAIAMIGSVAGAEVFIFLHESDDRAGGVAMGVLIAFGAVVMAAAAATLEQILQNAVELSSGSDPTE